MAIVQNGTADQHLTEMRETRVRFLQKKFSVPDASRNGMDTEMDTEWRGRETRAKCRQNATIHFNLFSRNIRDNTPDAFGPVPIVESTSSAYWSNVMLSNKFQEESLSMD
ncbi:hypothetical protein DAPPUDRAFT_256833 [Daphnia pulex]|uniref:Uncharacterized protein n=1 Tax=Daphnia pulex TaxID=6669 RepID=E9HC68_DAPPU|nr:hypothetical protein DAPPUDRAFT_256833 [Daphnia pulex]|eukprot:EFX70570.1 hypothetical protein DAPPUDRAFT_256833 [Daphnia pulex]